MPTTATATEAATTLQLRGVVCAGLGEGSGFVQLPWVRREFAAKLGFEPYPGTFNLHMAGADWDAARARIAREPGIPIDPEPGFCAARCDTSVMGTRQMDRSSFTDDSGPETTRLEATSGSVRSSSCQARRVSRTKRAVRGDRPSMRNVAGGSVRSDGIET